MNLADYISLAHPGPSSSPLLQGLYEDNWSMFGDHVRIGVDEKLAEHPWRHPVNHHNPGAPMNPTQKWMAGMNLHAAIETYEKKPEMHCFIRKEGDKHCVHSHQTGKNFGCYETVQQAKKRLAQMKRFR